MKPDLERYVRCPRCYGKVILSRSAQIDGAVLDGVLECVSCEKAYPVVSGVALLAVIDRTWAPMLKEFASRIEISERVELDGDFEKDREAARDYHEAVRRNADELLEESLSKVKIGEGTRVLEVGAGLGEFSGRMADMGANVVSMDVEWSNLHFTLANDVYGSYFSRVMGDANRIPFKDSTFDVTCCRSTLHHLDHIGGAIKEMARVTKPGGQILLISEPIRSMLDDEEEYLKGIFDYEQGLNERTVPVTEYTLTMARYCSRVTVSCYRPSYRARTTRLFESLGLDGRKFFKDFESVGLLHSFKLLLTGAEVNVFGRRNHLKARKPRPLADEDIIGYADELVTAGWAKEHIKRLHRSCIDAVSLPDSARLFVSGRDVATRGWHSPEQVGDTTYRYTTKIACCQLRNARDRDRLSLRLLGYPPGAGHAAGDIVVNGIVAGRFEIPGYEWVEVSFDKPPIDENVLEIVIRNDFTFVVDEVLHNGDPRELGVGVDSIRQE